MCKTQGAERIATHEKKDWEIGTQGFKDFVC